MRESMSLEEEEAKMERREDGTITKVAPSLSGEGWSRIQGPEWVIRGCKEGFSWDVDEKLVGSWGKNKIESRDQELFVDREWKRLCQTGVLEEGPVRHVSGMRTAPKKGPKKLGWL